MKKETRLILNIEEVEIDGKKHFRVITPNRDELIVALCRVLSDVEADHQLLDVVTKALTMVLGAQVDTKENLDKIFDLLRKQALLIYDDAVKWRENNAKIKGTQCS